MTHPFGKGWGAGGTLMIAATLLLGVTAGAADETAEPLAWQIEADLMGKFVAASKSTSSFRRDHNIQTGAEARVEAVLGWKDRRSLEIRAFGQSGERQGYLVSDYEKAGEYGLLLDFSSWREFYNARGGRPPQTSDGTALAGNFFPGTNDGRFFFRGGSPATDWLRGGFLFDYRPSRFLSNVYADLHLRQVDGEQTLAKGGAVFTDALNQVYPGATGLVDFVFPAQKEVDYLSYLASTGAESSLANVNWQFDFSYANHNLEASTTEVNFLFDPNGTPPAVLPPGTEPHQTEVYKEDTKLQIGKVDIAAARHITPSLYLYGAGSLSYARSDPEPEQRVGGPTSQLRTRWTDSSKVTRLSPVLSLGSLFQPSPAVVVRLDSSFRYGMQEGRISEIRDEADFAVGDTDTSGIRSRVDRNDYVGRVNLAIDGKLDARARVSFDARYRYRREEVNSERLLNIVGRAAEEEKFSSDRHRIEAGPSVRYRMRRGQNLEAGYRFLYEDFDVDVDRLAEQFVLNDFEVFRHRVFVKARGRVVGKLRGELRVEYENERRDMQRPLVDVDIFAITSARGKTERESWSIVPSLSYRPHEHWTLSGSLAVRQLTLELVGADSVLANADEIADFEYDAITETLTLAAGYRSSDTWSGSFAYSFFNSDDSVDSMGHHARLAGDYRLDETWRFRAQYGFYVYRRDATGSDDYTAHVVSLGVDARF